MKKLFLLFSLFPLFAFAQIQPGDNQYAVSLNIGYGHNLTYGSMANFDVDAYLPINQYFEMEANVRTSTANFHTIGLQLRPKFALPVGELYLEDRLMTTLVPRDSYNDFVHALSIGYMMQHVNVQIGMFTRVIIPLPYEYRTFDELICEPFGFIYRVEAFIRPNTSPWNISLCLSNVDDYQIERMWQPMFYLGGWYDVNDNWRVSLTGKLKISGMFHLNAHYYASDIRIGAQYKF